MKPYVVLFVAFVMLFKPLWPIAEYVVNYDYIKNVLCENKDRPMLHCDGKCYLAKQLAKESERKDRNPFGEKTSKIEFQTVVFFQSLPQMALGADMGRTERQNYYNGQVFISTLLTSELSEPPESA